MPQPSLAPVTSTTSFDGQEAMAASAGMIGSRSAEAAVAAVVEAPAVSGEANDKAEDEAEDEADEDNSAGSSAEGMVVIEGEKRSKDAACGCGVAKGGDKAVAEVSARLDDGIEGEAS